MTELVSMLVPLEGTLPGWPAAEQPSPLEMLGLLIGVPGLIFVVITILGKANQLIRAGRGDTDVAVDEPIWLGAAPADRAAVTAGDSAPVPGEGRRALTPAVDADEVGGASVRW